MLPICPPSKTKMNKGQYFKNSSKTIFLVSCPATPKTELININKDAELVICFGYPDFSKNKIGLKKIPPPIPIKPEKNPIIDPIIIEINFDMGFIVISFFLRDLLSINNKNPAVNKVKNSNISNKFFSIEIEPPIKAKGIDPIRKGVIKLKLIFFEIIKFIEFPVTTIILQINAIKGKI